MVEVEIIGDEKTREYEAAESLAARFREYFSENCQGKISLFTDIICHNQDPKEIDIFVMGVFGRGVSIRLNSKARYLHEGEYAEEPMQTRNIYLNDFCVVIELKDHSSERVNFKQNGCAWVRTRNKWSNASKQSEGQKHSLRNFFAEHKHFQPFISNLIWFANLGERDLPPGEHNFLYGNFTILNFFEKVTRQNFPYKVMAGNHYYVLSGLPRKHVMQGDFTIISDFERLYKFLTADFRPDAQGLLTRQKLEIVTQKYLKNQEWAKSIGQEMVIIRGRAGTGKTMRLLRIAFDLCRNQNARCLILTYNKALASDIRRLIALAGIGSRPEDNTVAVSTIHSFLYTVMYELGIVNREGDESPTIGKEKESFEKFPTHKAEFLEYLRSGTITAADLPIDFDFIMIDEGQDWPQDELSIITTIINPDHIIVTDGMDQMIRSDLHAQWSSVKPNIAPDFRDPRSKRFLTLRQKSNIISFINVLARQNQIDFDLQANPDLSNGRIIISTRPFDKQQYDPLLAECLAAGNKQYEMMFLVPPNFVELKPTPGKDGSKHQVRQFKFKDEYAAFGVKIWDGTSTDLRSEFPVEIDVHRLFQYDSCRGLEAWTTVCIAIDDFFEYKLKTHSPTPEISGLALKSESEIRQEHALRWLLIAFTRPIDTLFINIRQKNSIGHKLLLSAAERMPDIIEFID